MAGKMVIKLSKNNRPFISKVQTNGPVQKKFQVNANLANSCVVQYVGGLSANHKNAHGNMVKDPMVIKMIVKKCASKFSGLDADGSKSDARDKANITKRAEASAALKAIKAQYK